MNHMRLRLSFLAFIGLCTIAAGTPTASLTRVALEDSEYSTALFLSRDGATLVGDYITLDGSYRSFRWTVSGVETIYTKENLDSSIYGLSPDGKVVIFQSSAVDYSRQLSFLWTPLTGSVEIHSSNDQSLYVSAISADGATVVGSTGNQGFTYNRGVVEILQNPGYLGYDASVVSSNGKIVAGTQYNYAEDYSVVSSIVRWNSGIAQNLGEFEGNPTVRAISDDGKYILVNSDTGAFRWSAQNTRKIASPANAPLEAQGMSANGQTIFGQMQVSPEDSSAWHAFVWKNNVTIDLGTLGGLSSSAKAISNGGRYVVGEAQDESSLNQAFIWSRATGIKKVADLLTEQGVDLTGWQLVSANGVAVRNNKIILSGSGLYNNQWNAWIAIYNFPCKEGE
jgi:probable HAF family extracellular repeat protein